MAYFEDIEIGLRTNIGSHTFSQEDIIEFATKYDPQHFHIDPESAEET